MSFTGYQKGRSLAVSESAWQHFPDGRVLQADV
jgi:hypothetical protein